MSYSNKPLQSTSAQKVDFSATQALVDDDIQAINQLIHDRLRSDIALINQLSSYIVHSGGKRLRPMVVVLAARACQYQGEGHIALAAIIEFIHTATLLHDDVVDDSELRRGKQTANELFGNEAAVLVGDFLYSRSFEMMVDLGSMRVMEVLARTTNQIAEGEVMQLINCGTPETTESQYLDTIHRKTAKLFESGSQLAAVISNQSSQIENALLEYGRYLGTAFQLVDDILDYQSDSRTLGKNIGDDLAEGKPTLPIINAIERGNQSQRALLVNALENADRDNIDEVLEIMESTGSLAYTARFAQDYADQAQQAIAVLPDSPYRQALMDLALFAVERQF